MKRERRKGSFLAKKLKKITEGIFRPIVIFLIAFTAVLHFLFIAF